MTDMSTFRKFRETVWGFSGAGRSVGTGVCPDEAGAESAEGTPGIRISIIPARTSPDLESIALMDCGAGCIGIMAVFSY